MKFKLFLKISSSSSSANFRLFDNEKIFAYSLLLFSLQDSIPEGSIIPFSKTLVIFSSIHFDFIFCFSQFTKTICFYQIHIQCVIIVIVPQWLLFLRGFILILETEKNDRLNLSKEKGAIPVIAKQHLESIRAHTTISYSSSLVISSNCSWRSGNKAFSNSTSFWVFLTSVSVFFSSVFCPSMIFILFFSIQNEWIS